MGRRVIKEEVQTLHIYSDHFKFPITKARVTAIIAPPFLSCGGKQVAL